MGAIRGRLQLLFRVEEVERKSEDERREQSQLRPSGLHLPVAELDGRVVGQLG